MPSCNCCGYFEKIHFLLVHSQYLMLTAYDSILPQMAVVRQSLCHQPITDLPSAFNKALDPVAGKCAAASGQSVAVAVGSRCIDRIDEVVHLCLRCLKKNQCNPFVVPAMGSHGGATAQGQKDILAGLNLTEAAMGVPIIADMATETIGAEAGGMPLFFSSAALDADAIVLINRIKPHTKFNADIESGLCKMLTIGLGKASGAAQFHRSAITHSFSIIASEAEKLLGKLNILFAIGLLEDGHGQLSHIVAVLPENMIAAEKEMLSRAKAMMGAIPFDAIDVLIVDRMGKDISGIGMDSNVTGRHRDLVGDFNASPHARRIFVRDLSEASQGNANGIGLADVTTRRLVDKIDREKTFVNAITAISPEKAAIPMHFETDRQCLEACVQTSGRTATEELRVVRILNTADLEYLQVSRSLDSAIEADARLCRVSQWQPFLFDASDNLRDFYPYE